MLTLREIKDFYQDLPGEQLEIVLELRNLIAGIQPDICEIIQWKGLTYYDSSRGGPVSASVCQIRVRDRVEIGFIHGIFLPDPDHLLQGKAKCKRVLPIRSFEQAPWEAIRALIQAAAHFDPYSKTFK